VRRWNRHIFKRARDLWEKARNEATTPRQTGVAVGVGVLACFSPILWSHVPLALLLASVFRVNRVWAALGSQVPSLFGLLRPFIVLLEIELAHRIRTGEWVDLDWRRAVSEAPRLFFDLCVGAGILGVGVALLAGGGAYLYARRRNGRAPTPASAT
jgi:uncharacterized protein (DUF2062 family)